MRAVSTAPQDSRDGAAMPSRFDATREAIIERADTLERLCPDAVDISARVTSALHAAINGHATDLAGYREADYIRKQLRGVFHPITLEDLGWLGVHAPVELLEGVQALLVDLAAREPLAVGRLLDRIAPVVGCTVERHQGGGGVGLAVEVMEDAAALMDEAVSAGTAIVRDGSDGRIDDAQAHLERAQRVKAKATALEARLTPQVRGGGRS